MKQIFKPASKEEIKQRKEKYSEIKIKEWITEFTKKKNVSKNEDGSYDVNGDVVLGHMNLTKIPIKFRKVTGTFSCSFNNLITLENSPEHIGGSFFCYANNLITLQGCTKYIGENFYCNDNPNLKTLEGIGEVKGTLYSDIKK